MLTHMEKRYHRASPAAAAAGRKISYGSHSIRVLYEHTGILR